MNEKGNKRREWIKTAAIIFLAVMLVLTFFSNTIMNYSLPEVATQYVMSGSITARIRGTGVVESGDPYYIEINESRKVASVAVRVGDEVQKGDVLLYLEDVESEELKQAMETLESLEDALEDAQDAYYVALLAGDISAQDIQAANGNTSATTYRRRITALQNEIKAAEDALEPLKTRVAELQKYISDIEAQLSLEGSLDAIAPERVASTKSALDTAIATRESRERALSAAQSEVAAAQQALNNVSSGDADAQKAVQERLDKANSALKTAQANLDSAKSAEQTARNNYNSAVATQTSRENSQTEENLKTSMAYYQVELYTVNQELAQAQEVLDGKTGELQELLGQITNVMHLETYLDAIKDAQKAVDKAQEKVDQLASKAVDATVTADISGTVTGVNVVAGNTTSPGSPLVVLQPQGQGYTMSFSVTNEQARRLAVGDRADLVNAWRYDDVSVTLASKKPDTSNPSQNTMLTFNVDGRVTAGQTLSVSVGQQSANFDLIVPNSSIREDSNGKFILIIQSRSTPLGNRYIASRVDVEVLASDDTQSAISAAIYGYEYVITTSTKPVEAGQQVRLANN